MPLMPYHQRVVIAHPSHACRFFSGFERLGRKLTLVGRQIVDESSNAKLFRPVVSCGTGVVVLAGSSGAPDLDRAALLAKHGAMAMALRWFGGPGQPVSPCEIALEYFAKALETLLPDVDRVAVLGSSFGAEAALCLGSVSSGIDVIIGIAPSAFVWPGLDSAGELASHWTWTGRPLAFIPLDFTWEPSTTPPAYRSWYEQSLRTYAHLADAAAIPVERLTAELVLIAGGDDQVWPSDDWARLIESRRISHGLATTLITHPEAGHRVLFPGEAPVQRGQQMQRGGSDRTSAELGARAWPHILRALHLSE